MDDSLALSFMYLPDDCKQDKRGCLFEFFIFLLQFHALVLPITWATDFDLNGMMKDPVQDCTCRDRITQVFGPGFFFDVGCKN